MSEKFQEGEIFYRREWHFLRRLYERYGLVLSKDELIALKDDVRNGVYKPRALGTRTARAEYYVTIKGQRILIAANPDGEPVTALPFYSTALPPKDIKRQSISEDLAREQVKDGKAKHIRSKMGGHNKKSNFRYHEAQRNEGSTRYGKIVLDDEDDFD